MEASLVYGAYRGVSCSQVNLYTLSNRLVFDCLIVIFKDFFFC